MDENYSELSRQICQLTDAINKLNSTLSSFVFAFPVRPESKVNFHTDYGRQNIKIPVDNVSKKSNENEYPLLYGKGKSNCDEEELIVGEDQSKDRMPFAIRRNSENSGTYFWNRDMSQDAFEDIWSFPQANLSPFCILNNIFGKPSSSNLKAKKEGRVEKKDDRWIIVEKLELMAER